MTYNNALLMEKKGYGYNSDSCIPRGIDRLFRIIDIPELCYKIAEKGRKSGSKNFDQKIAQVIYGNAIRPFPISVGGEDFTLFERTVPERLLTDDLQSWKDLLNAARKFRLISLIYTEEDHVQPYVALPNGNWQSWEFGNQEIDLRGEKFDEMLSKIVTQSGGITTEKIWQEEAHVLSGGNRGIVLFPPEPI